MMTMEETNRWNCEDDDGNSYTVIERTHFPSFRPVSGSSGRAAGAKDYVLSDRRGVNWVSDGVFEIVATGKRIKSIE